MTSDVPENSIRLISVGEFVDILSTPIPIKIFSGRVARIADTLDPKTRTIKVMIELNNARGRLKPEMFGRIRHSGGRAGNPGAARSARSFKTAGRTSSTSSRAREGLKRAKWSPAVAPATWRHRQRGATGRTRRCGRRDVAQGVAVMVGTLLRFALRQRLLVIALGLALPGSGRTSS